jgi:protocatechuate 3,4-dioxygenase beta subunit
MRTLDEHNITDAVVEQMSTTPDPRLKQIMACLVKHLHQFAREADLTPEEWLKGIGFLTAVGQTCTQYRQEFILLSDTLGLSALVNFLHDKRAGEQGTKPSLLGPFYRQDSPPMQLGQSIYEPGSPGQEICIYGRVTDTAGRGIPNASIEIWQTDEQGLYDLQKHDPSRMDYRGHFHSDSGGNYHLRTVCPLGYLIPMDGPVGDMIRAQKRHGFRPAHIHFLIGAPGYRELVTALYVAGDDHIESDTVFGVSQSLVTQLRRDDPASPVPGLPGIHFDFVLGVAAAAGSGRVGADPSQILQKASH